MLRRTNVQTGLCCGCCCCMAAHLCFVAGNMETVMNLESEEVFGSMPTKTFAASNNPSPEIYLTGANFNDGRSVLYAMKCTNASQAYVPLLLFRFVQGDISCGEKKPGSQEWKSALNASTDDAKKWFYANMKKGHIHQPRDQPVHIATLSSSPCRRRRLWLRLLGGEK